MGNKLNYEEELIKGGHTYLYVYMIGVFGDKETALDWYSTYSHTLCGVPRELVLSGKVQEVEDNLGQIENGVYS